MTQAFDAARIAAGRAQAISRLSEIDLLIIGGGIVGAGLARDAAMRCLRVGLIEQHDFASGTSSRSSRLLHGGLRYLAQGRIGLVREASREKAVLHRIAPHLASPLAFIFPTYRENLLAQWAPWKLRIGVKMYDLLCGGHNLGASARLSAKQVQELLPAIKGDDLVGGVRYFDAFTNDARLVLDTLRSAGAANAALVNDCRFENATFKDGVWHCQLNDDFADRSLSISARCVINAAGPWAQSVPHSSVRLRLTKGVHLVIDRSRLSVPDAVVFVRGPRILFAIPWGERVILGTTDTDYDGAPEAVTAEPEDVDYILDVVNAGFPAAHLCQADIISTWAGLRPLIADPKGRPSDISRTHQIHSPEPGWWDVSGGKLTTYRLMAEQTIDQVAGYLKVRLSPCETAVTPLLPQSDSETFSGILPPPATQRVVGHYCLNEWARTLEDVMVRRTSWHYYRRDRVRLAEQVSAWMAAAMGWSELERRKQVDAYLRAHCPGEAVRPAAPVAAER